MPVITIQFDTNQLREIRTLLASMPEKIPQALSAAVNKVGKKVEVRTVQTISRELGIKIADLRPGKATGRLHTEGGVLFRRGSPKRPTALVTVIGHRRIPLSRFVRPSDIAKFFAKKAGKLKRVGSLKRYRAALDNLIGGELASRAKGRKAVTTQGMQAKLARLSRRAGRQAMGKRYIRQPLTYKIGNQPTQTKPFFLANVKGFKNVMAGAGAGNMHLGAFERKGKKRLPIRQKFAVSVVYVATKNDELKRMLEYDAGPELQKQISSQVDRFLADSKAQPEGDNA